MWLAAWSTCMFAVFLLTLMVELLQDGIIQAEQGSSASIAAALQACSDQVKACFNCIMLTIACCLPVLFQVAELCRLSFPGKPWMALVGLLHGLGKLLAHPLWGSQPQWAVAGESFPVGCKFAPQISASEFFSANPDRCALGTVALPTDQKL